MNARRRRITGVTNRAKAMRWDDSLSLITQQPPAHVAASGSRSESWRKWGPFERPEQQTERAARDPLFVNTGALSEAQDTRRSARKSWGGSASSQGTARASEGGLAYESGRLPFSGRSARDETHADAPHASARTPSYLAHTASSARALRSSHGEDANRGEYQGAPPSWRDHATPSSSARPRSERLFGRTERDVLQGGGDSALQAHGGAERADSGQSSLRKDRPHTMYVPRSSSSSIIISSKLPTMRVIVGEEAPRVPPWDTARREQYEQIRGSGGMRNCMRDAASDPARLSRPDPLDGMLAPSLRPDDAVFARTMLETARPPTGRASDTDGAITPHAGVKQAHVPFSPATPALPVATRTVSTASMRSPALSYATAAADSPARRNFRGSLSLHVAQAWAGREPFDVTRTREKAELFSSTAQLSFARPWLGGDAGSGDGGAVGGAGSGMFSPMASSLSSSASLPSLSRLRACRSKSELQRSRLSRAREEAMAAHAPYDAAQPVYETGRTKLMATLGQ